MIYVIIVLMIVSLIGSFSYRIILINRRKAAIDIKYVDLYKLNIENDYITLINVQLNKNKILIKELFDKKELIIRKYDIEKIIYDNVKDEITIVINELGGEIMIIAKYKFNGESIIVFPKNEKYSKR